MTGNIDVPAEKRVQEEPAPPLDHVIIRNADAPDECAIFPVEATEAELDTTWIVAQEGSFTDCESMR